MAHFPGIDFQPCIDAGEHKHTQRHARAICPVETADERAISAVREFVNEHERWEGAASHISTTGEYSTEIRRSLYSHQIRALLDIIDAQAEALGEITAQAREIAGDIPSLDFEDDNTREALAQRVRKIRRTAANA